jgi:hypothetical protein
MALYDYEPVISVRGDAVATTIAAAGTRNRSSLGSWRLFTANPADEVGESSFGCEPNGIEASLSNLSSWATSAA